MPRWSRVIRGMLGMGLTFGAIAGLFFGVLAVISGLFFPGAEDDLPFMVIAGTAWGFTIGVAFSGALALAAGRVRSFDALSLPRVAAIGAGGGLLLAGLLVGATWSEWRLVDMTVPFGILPALGAAAASGSLLVARRARPAVGPGDAPDLVEDGSEAGPDPRPGD